MKLKYAGPKPIISQHGISFKDGKEDKYCYLMIAIQILNAIDHEFVGHKIYSYDLNSQRLSDDDMINTILSYHPRLETKMEEEIESYNIHLLNEMEDVKNATHLSEIEKNTYINNLEIMKEYKIQRAKNKIFYFHIIDTICEVIIREKIKEINTPFFEKFWHILQTIEGELSSNRFKIRSELEVIQKDEFLNAKLKINQY